MFNDKMTWRIQSWKSWKKQQYWTGMTGVWWISWNQRSLQRGLMTKYQRGKICPSDVIYVISTHCMRHKIIKTHAQAQNLNMCFLYPLQNDWVSMIDCHCHSHLVLPGQQVMNNGAYVLHLLCCESQWNVDLVLDSTMYWTQVHSTSYTTPY